MTEEALKDRRSRQQAAADLLDEVLDGGLARERMRAYLRKALGLGRDDDPEVQGVLDALFWEPPRSLLLTVIPTIVRRLRSGWEGEPLSGEDPHVRMRTPLREFVAGNLFDDLLVPDVQVLLPGQAQGAVPDVGAPAGTAHDSRIDARQRDTPFRCPVLESAPLAGTPQPLAQEPSRTLILSVPMARRWPHASPTHAIRGREIYMYRPVRVVLDSPAETGRNAVRDATTSSPQWGVQLHALGHGTDLAPGPQSVAGDRRQPVVSHPRERRRRPDPAVFARARPGRCLSARTRSHSRSRSLRRTRRPPRR